MSPINRKPGMTMPSMFQSIGPTQLPAPAPMGGLMAGNLSDKSLMESPDDPMAVQADEESLAKQEAGFLPANMHCETCAHMDNAMCTKYGFPVADEDGCSQGYESVGEIIDTPMDDSGESVGMESPEGLEEEPSTDEEEIPEEETNSVDEEPEEENIGKGGKKSMKPVTGKGGKGGKK